MPYTTTSLTRAVQDVAGRLADPTFVRFKQPEVTSYLIEALRTWNALTGHFRDHATFRTVRGEPFYDLATATPIVCGYSVTDRDLIVQMQAHLLEPINATAWSGTDQFTFADVVSAIERRRDQFLLETGMVVHRDTYPIAAPPDGRIPIDEAIMTVRRAAWQTTDGVVTPLLREDVWTANHYAPAWVQAPNRPPLDPETYSVGETPPLTIQVQPPPLDTGVLDLVVVTRGARLKSADYASVLGIPDDWAWVVKFGALADLLGKDGLAYDGPRSAYAEARWQQGIQAAKVSSTVWAARINNVVASIDTLSEADRYLPNWQTGTGTPNLVLIAGDLLALTPVPDQGAADYSVTLDVVRRAPIPPTPDQPLAVGPELLDMLYDYAEHLAMFKEGPDGVTSTQPLLDRFMRMAGVTIALDWGQTAHQPALISQSVRDEAETPRLTEVPTRG